MPRIALSLAALVASLQFASSVVVAGDLANQLVNASMARIGKTVLYDPSYQRLSYPEGDVADDRGVCTDVVIRAYRAIGHDLQRLVHEDMRKSFAAYPKRWGLSRPDRNIDHRRVPNLRRFFARHGKDLRISLRASDYRPGDLVTWDLTRSFRDTKVVAARQHRSRMKFGRKPHIGIVTDRMSADGKRPLIVHNIGAGTRLDDILFAFQITGRYRYAIDGND